MQYKARIGKVWKRRETGEEYGNLLEIKGKDSIENYTQTVPTKKETAIEEPKKADKKSNRDSIFSTDKEDSKWRD